MKITLKKTSTQKLVVDLHCDLEFDIPKYSLCRIYIVENEQFIDISEVLLVDTFKDYCNLALDIYEKIKYPITGSEGEE